MDEYCPLRSNFEDDDEYFSYVTAQEHSLYRGIRLHINMTNR